MPHSFYLNSWIYKYVNLKCITFTCWIQEALLNSMACVLSRHIHFCFVNCTADKSGDVARCQEFALLFSLEHSLCNCYQTNQCHLHCHCYLLLPPSAALPNLSPQPLSHQPLHLTANEQVHQSLIEEEERLLCIPVCFEELTAVSISGLSEWFWLTAAHWINTIH